MIKNIVFDLGGVLVDFDTSVYLRHLGFNDEEVEKYKRIIFHGEEWGKYNASIFAPDEIKNILVEKYAEDAENIKRVFDEMDFDYIISEMKDSSEYLKELKNKGYKIYLLSDLSRESFETNSKMSFFEYIEGGIYSFEVGSIKPSDNNYICLINKFSLIPEETIFIDDRIQNIEAAEKFGIHGVQFTTLDEVKEKVSKLLEG